MNKKILAFVYNGEHFLLLRNNPKNPIHGGDYWFTVTGEVDKGETLETAVKREVKEETGLKVFEIFSLNWSSIYSWNNTDNLEKNFVAFVRNGKIKLNEEYIDHLWLELDNFIEKIKWDLNKKELKEVLKKAIRRELFFHKERVYDFRK